ncbi:polysaccharide deacetylase-related protein [Pseudoalteromonas luteoviolacea B = ATCC 29581]|nr:polysaccharide deacetylase-related protein [Pseudoalteromonas luteoviolacea B = ATCC 29581]
MRKTLPVYLTAMLLSFALDAADSEKNTSDKIIALSFDDSPRAANGYFSGSERADKLLKAFKQADVPQVAFFSVSGHLNEEGIARLSRYNDAGHIIANHSHSHPDINSLTLAEYKADVKKADTLLRQFSMFKPWYRFPYLREGDTLQKRDGMRQFLTSENYFNAYITINNYDWYIENLFQEAIKSKPNLNFDALKSFYIDTLMEGINYYHQLALEQLGRAPKHVLLLHEMDITAMFIDDLVTELKTQGWNVIPISDAYSDPIAQYETTRIMKYNPGRIGEIAKDNNYSGSLWHHTLNETHLKTEFEKRVLSVQ